MEKLRLCLNKQGSRVSKVKHFCVSSSIFGHDKESACIRVARVDNIIGNANKRECKITHAVFSKLWLESNFPPLHSMGKSVCRLNP